MIMRCAVFVYFIAVSAYSSSGQAFFYHARTEKRSALGALDAIGDRCVGFALIDLTSVRDAD